MVLLFQTYDEVFLMSDLLVIDYMDKPNHKKHENWFPTNINETKVVNMKDQECCLNDR